MLQDLPLNYPAIITKYLQARLDAGEFEVPEDEDVLLSGFDRVDFKGITYEFDLYEDDELVRITNLTTNVLYNVTKYDGREDYHTLPDLLGVLDYIESNTVFTVADWIKHYTTDATIHIGHLLELYTINTDEYIIRLVNGTQGFKVSGDNVHLLENITLCVTPDGITTIEGSKVLNTGSPMPVSCKYAKAALTTLFNSEHSFDKIPKGQRERSLPIINPDVFNLTNSYTLFGLCVEVGADSGVYFEIAEKQYRVSVNGHLQVNVVDKEEITHKSGYRNTIYMRIATYEEIQVASSILKLLNDIATKVE